ncbi:hypothetical protein HUG17_3922 [Dermatophagoides farinae]|uniref:RNA-directed DNA polymerase n=1 Tax=Dermatophagoides farinae TaxID=6954 RepID=A0A9D4NXE3_DERFA|nr:hypothetical protein HUG17_3922 [Dermatophagoides farinae]
MGHIAADCRLKKNAAKKNNSSELSSNKSSSSSSSSKTASNQTIPKEIASICDESNRIIPRQFLRSKINRKTVYCLIDSGSKVSVFPSSWPVEKFGQSVLHTANGSKMLVKGESIVKMNIDSCVIEHTVLIGNVTKPTLGRDFIKKISATITYDDIMYFTWMGNRRRVNLISEDQIDNVNDHDLTDAEVCALAVEHLTVDDDADNENVCGESEQSGVVNALINRYMDVFEGIGRTNLVEHSIELKTNKVINVKPYPVPYAYRDEVRRMLVEMEQNNIIDPNSFIQINHLWYFRHAGRDRLCIPQSRVKEILQLCHDKMNHIGQHKCLDIVFCRFYWPKWRNDVKQWIRKCACNVKKDNDPRPAKQPMCATDILNLNPFEKVAIDIMTLSTSESGNRYLFTLQDYRSKWIEAKASVDSSTERIIDWLEEVWNRFGKPKILISDRGSQFESREFIDYCARMGIEHHRTTPYHHQSNGMVERVHRTIWNLLRVVVADSHNDWDVHLPSVLGVYRNTVHAALGISPFEALFNRPPVIEVDNMFPTRVQPRVADNLKISKYIERMKGNYDERKKVNDQPIAIGTKVLVKHPTIQNRHCQKLLPVNKGPFVVAEQLSPNTYQVKDGDGELLNVHRDQIAPTEIEGVLSKIRKRGRPRKGV